MRRSAQILILLACVPFFLNLGTPSLVNPDEGRFAEETREMFVSGDHLVPRLHGEPHWAKPPLVNWLGIGFMKVLGVTNEAARLPSALGGCVMVIALSVFAWRARGPRAAVLTAWIAASTLHIAVLGRAVTTDMLHAAFTVAALVALHAAVSRPENAWRNTLFAGIFLGIAFLAKGPVGLGVTLVTLVGYAALSRSFAAAAFHRFGVAVLVALAIGLPWYLLAVAKHPPLLDHWLGHEVRDRYLSSALKRTKPWWFLTSTWIGGLLPWTPIAAWATWRAAKTRHLPEHRWLLAWGLCGFLLFQFSKSQLWTYLLPVSAGFVLLVALEVDGWIDRGCEGARRRLLLWIAGFPAIVAIGAEVFFDVRLEAETAWWFPVAAVIAAIGVVRAARLTDDRTANPRLAVFASAAVLLVTVQCALLRFGRHEDAMGRQTGHAWIADAVARLELRGVPIDTHVAPRPQPPLPKGVPRLVMWDHETNTLPFYAFGPRPEVIPVFGLDSNYEIAADIAADKPRTTEDLIALLADPEPLYILVLGHEAEILAEKLGRPLEVVERRGGGKAPILVRPIPQ